MVSSLGPSLLVASPTLLDPSFQKAVVLLAVHEAGGSFGLVINSKAKIDFGDVARQLGITGSAAHADMQVLNGGPVRPATGWIVYEPLPGQPVKEDSLVVNDKIHLSSSRDHLESVARGEGVSRRILVLGCSGWGEGQLESEIREGSWITVDLDEEIVFDTPLDERWSKALGKLGIDPRTIVGAIPDA